MHKRLVAIAISLLVGFLAAAWQLSALRSVPEETVDVAEIEDQRQSVQAASHWLVREFQNDDGGFSSLSSGANQASSSVAGTLDAAVAIAAAGYNPESVFPGQESTPVHFLQSHLADLVTFAEANGGQAGKVVLVLTSAALNPRDFEGQDFVAILTDHLEPDGNYGVADAFKQAIAILGVASADEAVPGQALSWLDERQASDGSWDDGFGTKANPDTTALVLMAYLAANRSPDDAAIQDAIEFLAGAQQTGGWAYGSGFAPGANSTALVIQALSALGEDWYSAAGPWVKNGRTPLQALMAFQNDTGAFQSDFGQGPFDDFYATVQAIPAMAGRPFPLPARLEAARHGLTCLDALQDPQTGGWASFAGGPVDAGGTSRAIQAIVAAGEDPRTDRWSTPGGIDAVEALESLTPQFFNGGRGGRVGIVIQGVVAAGEPADVKDFAGENLPLLIMGHLSPEGDYDDTSFGIFAHAEAMRGLAISGEPVAPTAIERLFFEQSDGDWGEPDANGIALQVLGDLSLRARPGTLVALRNSQLVDGGWGVGGGSNPSASSEVVQGLTAIGQNPFGPEWTKVVDGQLMNAADYILSHQGKNGCWPNALGPGDDPFSTTDAILLLTQEPEWGFSLAHLPVITDGQ